jgi:hypothetical protein
MTIDPSRCEVTWPAPKGPSANPTLVVVDAAGTRVEASWTITVTNTGFRFVDAEAGSSTGTGTKESPWRTLADVWRGAGTDIVYFRKGTYTPEGIPTEGSALELRVVFNRADSQPTIWLAYPSETPIIDQGYTGSATPRIRVVGDVTYIDGFTVRNIYVMGFQVMQRGSGAVFRRMAMSRLAVGGDGSNAAFIMTTNGTRAYGMVVQDSSFADVSGESAALKFYATDRLIVEDCRFSDIRSSAGEALAVKESNRQFTIRTNTFEQSAGNAIGGNMADGTGTHSHTGEIAYNNVRAPVALRLNQNGETGETFAYRNTLLGKILIGGAGSGTTNDDGPFTLDRNVIVNGDTGTAIPFIDMIGRARETARIVLRDNLTGTSRANLVDNTGRLVNRALVGSVGHERP